MPRRYELIPGRTLLIIPSDDSVHSTLPGVVDVALRAFCWPSELFTVTHIGAGFGSHTSPAQPYGDVVVIVRNVCSLVRGTDAKHAMGRFNSLRPRTAPLVSIL